MVERGPEVFALESVDLAGTELAASDFADLRVDPGVAPRDDADGTVVATIVDERTGIRAKVWFIPPPHVDPARTPRLGGRARYDYAA